MEKKDLVDQCELIQDDLHCVLDGIEDKTMIKVCQIVVEHFRVLITKLKNEKSVKNRG